MGTPLNGTESITFVKMNQFVGSGAKIVAIFLAELSCEILSAQKFS